MSERKGGKPSEEGEIKRGNVNDISSNREEHSGNTDQAPRDWWNSLNPAWKKVFKGAINITEEPTDSELDSMIALESLSIYTEMSNLQKQLSQQPMQAQQQPVQARQPQAQMSHSAKSMMLHAKKERAKKNIEKGFYNEASIDIQEALQLEPNDPEAKAIHAKIKTLQ